MVLAEEKILGGFVYFSLACFFILAGCGRGVDVEKEKEALIKIDRAFSSLSADKGIAEAFHHYIADDGMALPKYGHPQTRQDYQRYMTEEQGKERRSFLEWEPTLADVASSGDLGYTQGRYKYVSVDSIGNKVTTYGYYVTVWKKQTDGSWRFVMDAGNESPNPEER